MENKKVKILKNEIPKHIGIIMDGNGRWAEKRNLKRSEGHKAGAKNVIKIVEASRNLNIKYLSLYAFSTENWKRPENEIKNLFDLLITFIDKELARLVDGGVKLNILGDISKLPRLTKLAVEKALKKTEKNEKMILNIALNYGGQDEIIHGIKKLFTEVNQGRFDIDDLNTDNFNDFLYTKNQAYPDLIIRPSGELRISNFLIYQLAYSEFYFSNILWPDFSIEDYYNAILDYQDRNRRFGGL